MNTSRAFVAAGLALSLLSLGACQQHVADSQAPTPKPLTLASPVPTPSNKAAQMSHTEQGDKGDLRAYYRHKYGPEERQSVEAMIADILPSYSPQEKSQTVAEILAFHHVVFHRNQWHHLDKNHKTIRKYEKTLKELCAVHGVPFLPVLAITSWENSGGSDKVSGVDAAGLGQMTWGAVDQAHAFAAQESRRSLERAQQRKRIAEQTGDPKAMADARVYAQQAARMDVEARHHDMARKARVPDERFLAECNLEDVVLFYKFLLSHYPGRVDHAIGAYHKGLGNQDDLIYDYLKRKEPGLPHPSEDRTQFLAALEKHNVTYLDLWNDPRSRQMLNGLRTMDGEVTTSANADQALGDEADLYPWKVLGSLAAYRMGPEYVDRMIARYNSSREVAETDGIPAFKSLDDFDRALKSGHLVKTKAPLTDLGVANEGSARARDLAWCVTPELEGYLFSLVSRLRDATGDDGATLPIKALSRTAALESGKVTADAAMHLRGIAATLSMESMPAGEARALEAILQSDWLHDRIYRDTRPDGTKMFCLNPRYGNDFLLSYDKRASLRGGLAQRSQPPQAAQTQALPAEPAATPEPQAEVRTPPAAPTPDEGGGLPIPAAPGGSEL